MIDWLLKKLFKNYGEAAPGVFRSGQPGFIRRWIMYRMMKYRVVLNLAWNDADPQDMQEFRFCQKRNIRYIPLEWGAGGPKSKADMWLALSMIETSERPLWVHCEGGKDRAGGLIAFWKKFMGYGMDEIFEDFKTHKYPAWRWIEFLLQEEIS